MTLTRRPRYIAQLPATPCTPQMREQMVEIAERRGVSLAEVQREAYSFFLAHDDRKSNLEFRKANMADLEAAEAASANR